jgi:hypothetical protein
MSADIGRNFQKTLPAVEFAQIYLCETLTFVCITALANKPYMSSGAGTTQRLKVLITLLKTEVLLWAYSLVSRSKHTHKRTRG